MLAIRDEVIVSTSGRPKNTYVREDQILPHLAAVAILLNGHTSGLTTPDRTASMIDQLWARGIILTYDPDTRTIRTGDRNSIAVTVAAASCHHQKES
jgi:site-specific DNA recombinase